MSSFIVNDQTLNEIVSCLRMRMHKMNWSGISRLISEAGYDITKDDSEWQRLGEDMFWTNCIAVDERYGKGQAKDFRELNYEYKFLLDTDQIQAYKSLRCWLYQCCEGEAETSPLYELMNKIESRVATAIVSDMPRFENARWG